MIQAVLIGVGGQVETYFIGFRPATCTVNIIDADGSAVVTAGSCTVDAVNTLLSANATEGDTVVTVASPAGIVIRRRYLLGDEEVTVKSVTGSAVTLCAPLARAHVSSAPFQGLRVSYAVSSGTATSEKMDMRAVFVPAGGEPQAEVVEFVPNKVPELLISEVDIRKIYPKDKMALSAELDLPQALVDARDQLLLEMGGRHRAHLRLGVKHLRLGCSMLFWLMQAEDLGEAHAAAMERLQKRFDRWLHMVDAQSPTVSDDGTTTQAPGDGAFPDFDLAVC